MNLPATMFALRQMSLNGPGDLRPVTDAPVPGPGPGEILIRVTAAGVNYADLMQAHGAYPGGPRPPYVAGIEAAGEVVAIGQGVEFPPLGTHVVGVDMRGGAFAEYATLPAAAAMPVPPGWTDAQVLGLGINWPTALAALKSLGRIASGETVLIHAAAGATGRAAVILAEHYGAIVLAAASPAKHDAVRALGADHVLDSRAADLAAEVFRLTGGAGVDLVLESAGGETFAASLAVAKRVTGRVVVYGTAGGDASITNRDLVFEHQVQLIGLNIGVLIGSAPAVFGELMGELSALVATGVITPVDPAVHRLADGSKVLAELENRATVGKLALAPDSTSTSALRST
ncbi:zinc-binding dehydrogenase [Nocardia sp. ET3-3]|uniref:Zinc-binding dehydrogenase n=1 Tax=Nocardia terrae TaxID=2675851 RepID=A0A7K1V892_9NOCA|nr:zinc-binding dehydrogenase [Nocardia terrae]